MADNSTTNVFWWLLGLFRGPLAIKEDIFGLFGPFLVFRELKSEQKQPFYASLKSNSTILDPIMSQCGLEMHKLLSKYIWIWLQIGVKWLFLVWFEVSKDPKRPNLSSFIARNPQNFPSSHKKNLFGGHKQRLQGCRFNFHRTSCTCKPSTIWKCSKVVHSIWVGQSEFFKGWSDCYWGLEVADTQIW